MSYSYTYRGVTPDHHILMKPQTPTNNSPRIQSYVISSDTWPTTINSNVTIERGLCAGAFGPWVFMFGGAADAGASFAVSSATRIFDADAGTVATGRTNPTPRDGAVCPIVRGCSMLIVGGTATGFTSSGDRGSTTVHELTALGIYGDSVSVSRTAITGKRTEAGWGNSTATNALAQQYGFIAGGFERTSGVETFLTSAYEWNANGGAWAAKTSLSVGKYPGGCFTIENETYLLGGALTTAEAAQDLASADISNTDSNVSWNRTSNSWTTREEVPGAKRRLIGSSQVNDIGYLSGGSSDGANTVNYASHYSYDPNADAYTTLTSYNTPAAYVFRGAGA